MKQAVVYYSFDGNTRAVAKSIAEKLGAEIFELEEVKKRPEGQKALMSGGFQAFFGIKTKLKNYYSEELKDCEKIYIGSPIWAGKTTPAVKSFVIKLKADGKSVYVFTLQASDVEESPGKAATKLAAKLKAKGASEVKAMSFKGAGIGDCISDDSAMEMVEKKLQL